MAQDLCPSKSKQVNRVSFLLKVNLQTNNHSFQHITTPIAAHPLTPVYTEQLCHSASCRHQRTSALHLRPRYVWISTGAAAGAEALLGAMAMALRSMVRTKMGLAACAVARCAVATWLAASAACCAAASVASLRQTKNPAQVP